MKKRKKEFELSVIIPLYNAATTLEKCLDSLFYQTVKVKEIIMVDNTSTDNSIMIIRNYQKKHPSLPIYILLKKDMTSVAASYNLGLEKSTGDLVVGMHADSTLPTKYELANLIKPLENNSVVATYSYVLHPIEIWNTYNFWEKCQHARLVEKTLSGMNGKFDCYRKSALIRLHGFDDVNFKINGDGSDADIYLRLKTLGNVVLSEATVVHLHHLNPHYSLSSWVEKRRNLAILSGRLLRMYLYKLDIRGILSFTFRPIVAILPFIPGFTFLGIIILISFSFLYTSKMFITPALWRDPRIILLPFINIFLVYFESFWFIRTLLVHQVRQKKEL
jgi:glycosyltransferase involved in cell wall biosynthesis